MAIPGTLGPWIATLVLLIVASVAVPGCALQQSTMVADSPAHAGVGAGDAPAPRPSAGFGLILASSEIATAPDDDASTAPEPPHPRQLVIVLATQEFIYSEDGQEVHRGPVSTGRRGYRTPTGSFQVLSKQRHKVSNRYKGSGGRPASMPYSIQFRGHYFIHQGKLPGYPASHGCIRLNKEDARLLFEALKPGDPILIWP